MRSHPIIRRTIGFAALTLCALPRTGLAQVDRVQSAGTSAAPDTLAWFPHLAPNSEDETYLRYLQIVGAVPQYPWSLRGFSPSEARKLAWKVGTLPSFGSASLSSQARNNSRVRLLPFSADLRGNSSYPYGSNDGPVWTGRGLTASATFGVAVSAGSISLVLAPAAFMAQNASFDLLHNGLAGDLRFADGLVPGYVDRPQRFGDKPYGRVDPGNSTLRADVGPLTAGISTANMAWGPFELYPYVLGTNAPGFVHGFVGTSRPLNVWIGRAHGRVMWGQLDQSEYSSVEGEPTYVSPAEPGTRRFTSGLLLLLEPRGVSGLELGVARFFHSPWPRSGIPGSYLGKPFESFLKHGLTGAPEFADPATSAENQLISGFGRWVFPSAGLEIYAEYGRDDHSWDKRDFVQEPDHSRSYGLGFRKTVRLRPNRLEGITVELINFQLPHLDRTGRGEGSVYLHTVLRQGHTNRGQLLGADVGVGGAAGSTIRWDRYHPRGRAAVALHRVVRQSRSAFLASGTNDPKLSDVQYALDGIRVRDYRRMEIATGVALVHGFNRDFRKDATNVSVLLKVRIPLRR